MHSSFRALMGRLIDYAGLFPPARLPLRESLSNYLRYKLENDSWMLGRFICPAQRLPEVSKLRDQLFAAGPPIEFSAVGQSSEKPGAFLSDLVEDLTLARDFVSAMAGRALVDVLEVKLPSEILGGSRPERLLSQISQTVRQVWPGELTLFFEVPREVDGWRNAMVRWIEAFARRRETQELRRIPRRETFGVKLRCGGETASATPSVEDVALVLWESVRWGIPFKATAGLHHPIRRFDQAIQGRRHGFLNVFGAGVLIRAGTLAADRVAQMLTDEEPDSFQFDDDAFQWKSARAETATIARARKDGMVSFGSCSFDEPREDLRALGLLEEVSDLV